MIEYIPVIVAIIAAIPGVWALVAQSRQEEAETSTRLAQIQEDIEAKLWARVQEELDKAQDEIRALRQRVTVLEAENASLRAENASLRATIGNAPE